MQVLITLSVAIIGLCYTAISSFIIWGSIDSKMKGFLSAQTRAKLILSDIIMYFILLISIAYFFVMYDKETGWVKNFYVFLIGIYFFMFIVGTIIMVKNYINGSYSVYFVIENKVYRLKYIENDILFLITTVGKGEVLLKEKSFLFCNSYKIFNSSEYENFKKERPDLFKKS